MIHKPTVNQIVAAEQQQIIEEDTVGKGRDLDAESTCQNFNKVARKGDISPRFMEKGKSVGKRKEKQVKGVPSIQPAGVQTRRTMPKSNI